MKGRRNRFVQVDCPVGYRRRQGLHDEAEPPQPYMGRMEPRFAAGEDADVRHDRITYTVMFQQAPIGLDPVPGADSALPAQRDEGDIPP